MGLNHIYKVIWSKTKNAWVVVSEIAKRDGKSSVKSVVTSLAGKSVAAVMVAMVMCGGVASADTQYGNGAVALSTSPELATAIGDSAQAKNFGSVAVGHMSKANSTESIAVGYSAETRGDRAIAIGYIAQAGSSESIAIGGYSNAGQQAIALGERATASTYATAVGAYSKASDINATAVGNSAQAKEDYTTAIGSGAVAERDYATVIGAGNRSEAARSVNIGMGSSGNTLSSSAVNSIVIGSRIQTQAQDSLLIGSATGLDASARGTIVIGRENNSSGGNIKAEQSIILGNHNNARESGISNSILIGSNTMLYNSDNVFLGNNIVNPNAAKDGAVVIGSNSSGVEYVKPTDTVINGVTLQASNYRANGNYYLTAGSTLSVGAGNKERQIKYVAAGEVSSSSTDAINGSQLYEAMRAVTLGANPDTYVHVNDGTGSQGAGNASSNLGKANEKGGATGQYSIAIGYNTNASGARSLGIGYNNSAVGDDSGAFGGSNYASNTALRTYILGIGNGNSSTPIVSSDTYIVGGYNIADKANSSSIYVLGANNNIKSSDVYLVGKRNTVIDSDNTYVNGADNRVTNAGQSVVIGNSVELDDAPNSIFIGTGRIFPKTSSAISSNGSKDIIAIGHDNRFESGDSKRNITLGNYNRSFGKGDNIIVGTSNISGVRIQFDDGTFVDGGKTGIFGNGYGVSGSGNYFIGNSTINPLGISPTGSNGPSRDSGVFGNNSYFVGYSGTMPNTFAANKVVEGSRIIGNNSNVGASDVMVVGNNVVGIGWNMKGAVVLGSNSRASQYVKPTDSTINGDTFTSANYAGQGTTSTPLKDGNIVSVGAVGNERQIKNVAAGEVTATSTDAINGSQLYSVADQLAKGGFGYMHVNDGTTTQKAGTAATNYGAGGSKGGALGNYSVAIGWKASAEAENSITIATSNYSASNRAKDSIIIGKNLTADSYNMFGSGDSTNKIIGMGTDFIVHGKESTVIGHGIKEGTATVGSSQHVFMNDSTMIGNRNGNLLIDPAGTVSFPTSLSDTPKSTHIVGNDNAAYANNAVIVGNESTAFSNGVAIGNKANTGTYAHRTDKGIAIGYNVTAEGHNSIVQGTDSNTYGDDAIAIGHGAKALADKSISIGTGNEVKGAKSSAIGDPSYIDTTATGTHVQGNDNGTATNPIKASESTFMGNTNLAGTAGTTGIHVVGNSNTVDSSNVMVMGNGVSVGTGLDGAVVLGNASSADQYAAATDSTINGVTFEAAGYAGNTGLNNGSIVSVGATGTERQIKNVAAGAVTATSTDAVNGSQLYKTAETILKMPINMAGDSGDTVGLKLGKTVNIKGSVTSGADVTDGNIAVVGDKATSTLSLKMAKNLTGLTSGTFTDATGNQTVINGAGVTVTPTGTGATPISITTSGINAGNQEIKGVKKGTTDDAAVNKKQMDDALAGISSTLTINDGTTDGSVNIKTGKLKVVGESGANALVTTTVSGDTITVGTSTKLQNAVTAAEKSADKDLSNLSTTGSDKVKTLAQDAVKVTGTGLATVSDATAAGVKTYTVNVDEGKLVIDDTTGKLGATGATQGTTQGKNGVATTQNVADVVNSAIDKTKQALTDAKHDFAGDDATVISRKHGEQLNIKGGASTTATDLTSGNIAVVGDTTSGTLNIKMAKALTGLTSATYTDGSGNTQTVTGGSSTISDAAGNSTVVSKGGVTTTDAAGNTTTTAPTGVTVTPTGAGATPISVTTSGISAGNKEIKNVANGTTDDAAVNKKQMDDALKGATDNTVSLGSESGTTTAKKLSTTGGIKFNIKGETGANALISTSASGDDVTIAPTAKLTAAVTAAEKSADKDLSNISTAGETVIKNLAATSAQDAVKVTGTGLATVSDSIAGGVKTYNVDVKTGNLVVNAAGQAGAAGTTGAGGAAGADGVATTQNVATAINDAITKSKTDTAQAIADAEHKFDGDTGATSVRKHGEVLSVKGGVTNTADLATGNIGVVSDGAGTLNIRLAKVLSGLTSASFTNAGGDSTVINGNGVTITPSATGASSISMTTAGINAGNKEIKGVANATSADAAVNKGQMDAAITAAAGGSLSTEKVVAKTLTGDNNLATVTGQNGTAKGETYEVAVSENAVKAVAATAAQDAVKVAGTGLATVSDATAAGVKTYTVNVDEGKLVIDDTTGKVGANGATQGTVQGKNGVATTQDVASVVNSAIDKTKQALDDAKHNFAGDDATVISRKHGEQLNIKGGASTTATDLTSGNIAVVGDTTSGTLNIKMAKALTGLTSATYTDGSGNTQTVTGGSSTISDAAGNSTVVSKGGVTTTDAAGNTTTTAPTGVTVTPAGAGATPISVTTSGISAGNKEIKNVANGTTDDAAVNKKQMDDALKGATDNTVSLGSESGTTTAKKLSTTGGIKFNIKGETGANALITTSATGDDVTIAPTAKLTAAVTAAEKSADKDLSNISTAGETVIKNLAATSAQDAVKVTGTGLATVSDSTTGGVKTYNVDVKTGNLVVNAAGQAGAAGATGAGGAAGADGVATTQNVATAINDAITKSKTDTAQAIADAEHKFDGDTGATSVRKHGEVLSVKGGVTAPADLTTGNIGVVSDGAGTLNIRLAKVLSGLTSATYTDAAGNTQTVTGGSSTITDGAGNTTTITKGGMTTTDGTNTTTVTPAGVTATDGTNTVKLTGSGIDAGNTQIKNVGKATTDDAAVNKKQMDDAVKAATDSISTLGDNKVSLGSDSGTTTAKKLSTTGGITFNIKGDTGANALISTSATGDDVTIAPTAKLTAAVTAAEKSADKDLSNLSAAGDTYIKNLAKTAASWNVETNGAGTTAVAGGETVNFINGDNIAITNTGRSITIGTARNVSFDKVTVGGIVLDNNTGINAGGKEIKGVANATSADAAVNKGQLDAAVLSAAGGALSIEKVEAGSIANGKLAAGDNNLASVSGLTGTAKNETYTVTVSENAVKAVAQTAAQDAVKVTGTGLANVTDTTTGGVKTYNVDVKTGNLVVNAAGQAGATGTTGAGGAAGADGVATTQNVATAINDAITKSKTDTAQAIADAEHKFDGDTGATSVRKHGEVLSIKGGVTAPADLTTGNIGVVSDGAGTLNIRLAKVLSGLTSATYTDGAGNTQTVTSTSSTITDGAGNTTTITKGGMTTTDGTNTTTVAPAGVTATDGTNTVKLNGSGIDAGNTQIKNVGKATTDDAAVNKKQMDDAVKAATDSISTLGDNKVSLGSDSGTTTAKKLSTTGGIKFNIKGDTGANALITTSATGDDVTIAPTAKLTAAVTAAEKSADKDLSNISPAGETVIKNLAATSDGNVVKYKAVSEVKQ